MLLLIKHVICDLAIQPTSYPNDSKRHYFGLHAHLQHYVPHGIGTFLMLLVYFDWKTALVWGFVDYLAHWHIDYTKTGFVRRSNLNRTNRRYWVYNAIDQFAHFATYYVIVMELIK